MDIGEIFSKYINDRVNYIWAIKKSGDIPELPKLVQTDSLGETIEKLVILTVRIWALEDKAAENYNNDKELAEIKRKIDICFKTVRPRLVEAINLLIDQAIIQEKSVRQDSIKLYKGH